MSLLLLIIRKNIIGKIVKKNKLFGNNNEKLKEVLF